MSLPGLFLCDCAVQVSYDSHSQSDSCGPDVSLEARPAVIRARGYLRGLEGGAALTCVAVVPQLIAVQFLHDMGGERTWRMILAITATVKHTHTHTLSYSKHNMLRSQMTLLLLTTPSIAIQPPTTGQMEDKQTFELLLSQLITCALQIYFFTHTHLPLNAPPPPPNTHTHQHTPTHKKPLTSATPKSVIFTSSLAVSRRLPGLMSLWTTP